jgi:hypothetical protein
MKTGEFSWFLTILQKNKVDGNDFINDAIGFENMMNKKYGDDAPLFCDEEKYFHLSKHAELVNKR